MAKSKPIKHLTEEQKIEIVVELCQERAEMYAVEQACWVTRGEQEAFVAGFKAGLEKIGIIKKEWFETTGKTPKVILDALKSADLWCDERRVITYGEKAAYTDGFYVGADKCWEKLIVNKCRTRECIK